MARVRPAAPPAEEAASPAAKGPARLPAVRPKSAGTARKKVPASAPALAAGNRHAGQVALLVGIAACAFAVLALATYDPHDPSISHVGAGQAANLGGPVGSYLADGLLQVFGYAAWCVVPLGAALTMRLAGRASLRWGARFVGAIGFVLLATALELALSRVVSSPYHPGGLLGFGVSNLLVAQIGRVGAGLAVGVGLLGAGTVLFRIDWQPVAARAVERVETGAPAAARGVGALLSGLVSAVTRGVGGAFGAVVERVRREPEEEMEEEELEPELDEIPAPTRAPAPAPVAAAPAGEGRAPELLPARRAPPERAAAERAAPARRAPVEIPEVPSELPSVWSARAAPDAAQPRIARADDRDAPTQVGERVLVEVEWERTGAVPRPGERSGRSPAVRDAGLPAHLRGATPAPVSAPPRRTEVTPIVPVSRGDAPVAPRRPEVPAPPPAAPEGFDPIPLRSASGVVSVPPPVVVAPAPAAVEWADEPEPLDWAEGVSSPGRAGSGRPSKVAFERPSVAPPVESRLPDPVEPARRAFDEEELAPRAAAPVRVEPPARVDPPSRVDAPVRSATPPEAVEPRAVPPSEPAAPRVVAPPEPPPPRRPRPSGDGVTVMPGNLKSGGAGDDGRAVRKTSTPFQLPPLSLLDDHPAIVAGADEGVLHEMARRLMETLRDFQVDGRVVAIRPGPVITMFEYEPAPGVKLSRIATLADNLKMALKAVSVRIVAPLPGKGCVGIEIPNERRHTVWARDVFASPEFKNVERALPMILGKDTEGRPFVTDLAKMPHLLVGGTTGSGKSVGVNSMLVSMLFMRTPEELRMILIDPKMLEFALYEDIPHLLHPVVTEPKFASAVLKWACTEMDERYKTMARWQTRHIDTYNQKVEKELEDWTPQKARMYAPKDWPDGELLPIPRKFPYIVIVIDELADLMMVASSDVEASISRIVAKARAAGIHLIVATQTPRRDVITGLIKANMPSSLAYQVRSALDSRVILDQNGAETLLGKGDLLFLRPGTSDLVRVHGPFLSEDEVHRVADFLRAQGTPEYDLRIASADGGGDDDGDEPAEYDALYDEAVELAIQKGKISTSMLQRHLGIGYNRAANIVETMEREGVVGPADGAKPREVLVGQQQ